MSNVHRDVVPLLAGLDESPLGWLADRARERIDQDEEKSIRKGKATDRRHAFRQLEIIDDAVMSAIHLERELIGRLTELAGGFRITTIDVLPVEEDRGETEGVQSRAGDQLLGPQRAKAFADFSSVWGAAVSELRVSLERDGG